MNKRLVVISGVSGAGKSTASNILEDMGYRCIDQYPVELLDNLVELILDENSFEYQKIALTIPLSDLQRFYNLLVNISTIDVTLILFDASAETIINRYKFTRRVHPLLVSNKANTLEEAVEIEKGIIGEFKGKCHIIDTTTLTIKQHKEKLDRILKYDDYNNFSISFISFGFKNGLPADADLVFDVRILDNPYYLPELREKTGNDDEVRDYVLEKPLTQEYLKKLIDYIDFTLNAYDNGDKRHLTICIGCTGGQHRSVTVANYLYEHYKEDYMCYIRHREQSK